MWLGELTWTDCLNMNIDVDWDVKPQYNNNFHGKVQDDPKLLG